MSRDKSGPTAVTVDTIVSLADRAEASGQHALAAILCTIAGAMTDRRESELCDAIEREWTGPELARIEAIREAIDGAIGDAGPPPP